MLKCWILICFILFNPIEGTKLILYKLVTIDDTLLLFDTDVLYSKSRGQKTSHFLPLKSGLSPSSRARSSHVKTCEAKQNCPKGLFSLTVKLSTYRMDRSTQARTRTEK